ncbi:uncharacterized protein DNG_02804 [Cephalotrichum gorgonifer]|uniref:Calcineurin-like phosphoesterase domain-containing protein n=1 Tax=Cephalotrichum gorgonifer TaxID=2041049 RepID=A0AAE8STE4_9PEZI|nr:uncharacterized protein DNG_02804 [Cephalotrichum gorgonifer]
MNVLAPIYGRRRRPMFLIVVVFLVCAYFYTSDRLLTSSASVSSNPPIPVADPKPDAAPVSTGQQADTVPPKVVEAAKPKEQAPVPVPPKKKPQKADDIHMQYGTASRPGFDGFGALKKLGSLPKEHMPEVGSNKRLIIVGDVHGMITPLQFLLGKLKYDADSGNDHLVFVGDMVSEGPDSAAVVELAMTLKASAVRGVHEDRVLLARNATAPGVGAHDDLEQQHLSHGDYDDRIVAETLTEDHVNYLADLPVILDLGYIPTLQNAYVAHAGLVPGLPLEKQDPWPAMHMRSIVYPIEQARREKATKKINNKIKDKMENSEGQGTEEITEQAKQALIDEEYGNTRRPSDRDLILPVDDYSGEDWAAAWNEIESTRAEAERRTIFYGHDTKRGLNLGPNSVGLNTKCVNGGQLTAFVVTGGATTVEHETVQVDCEEEVKPTDD